MYQAGVNASKINQMKKTNERSWLNLKQREFIAKTQFSRGAL